MSERDNLIRMISERLTQAVQSGQPSSIMDPEAFSQARHLVELLDRDESVECRHLLGWLHWHRYQALPEDQNKADLQASLEMFGVCFIAGVSDDDLPPPLLPVLAERLVSTAALLNHHALVSREPKALSAAIGLWRRILSHTPADRPEYTDYLSDLGSVLVARFERSGSMADADEAVETIRRVVRIASVDHPNGSRYLTNLAAALLRRYERSGNMADLDEAIELQRRAIEAIPADDPGRTACLNNLIGQLKARYDRTGATTYLDEAIELGRSSLENTPADRPHLTRMLNSLGLALGSRAVRTGVVEDLDEAIGLFRRSVQATPADDRDRITMLHNLAGALATRFQLSGVQDDLDEAIELQRQVLQAVPADDAHHVDHLTNLGRSLTVRSKRSGTMTDLEEAIELFRRAVQNTPTDHPDHVDCLNNLASALGNRFSRSGTVSDLDQAVELHQRAVEGTSTDHPRHAKYLNDLAVSLRLRFARLGKVPDLNRAGEMLRQAIQAVPDDHPDQAVYLSVLASVLEARFEALGGHVDLDETIAALQESIQAAPVANPYRVGMQSMLASALKTRFKRFGTVADLDAAILVHRQALQATPEDHPSQASRQDDLAVALLDRFQRSGMVADLNEAVEMNRRAIRATPADSPDHATGLANLGFALWVRFGRFAEVADLDEAIESDRQAIQVMPSDHPQLATALNNLGIALRVRFESVGATADLNESIEVLQRAVQVSPIERADRPRYLRNLQNALMTRYDQSGDAADADAAIDAGRRSVRTTPADHPDSAGRTYSLALALLKRFQGTRAAADRDEAASLFSAAAEAEAAPPSIRVRAGRVAGELLAEVDKHRAAELMEQAVRLLAEVAPRELEREDQLHAIGETAGLAGDAAALVLADESRPERARAETALGLLEFGRARVTAQLLETRTGVTELRRRHPQTARRFLELRTFLDQPEPADTFLDADEGVAVQDHRRAAARELGELLSRIRGLKGFASFAMPPAMEELQAQGGPGPVVTFNITRFRSDALLLTPDSVTCVPLPALDHDTLTDQVHAFYHALDETSSRSPKTRINAETQMGHVLQWLWDAAAEPVLNALGLTSTPPSGEPWPRVWWSPGGLLGLLPLHAAGYHCEPADRNRRAVLNRVISSYTPLIGALRHARRPIGRRPDRALIVAMPTTPGLPNGAPLPNVAREAEQVAARLPESTALTEPPATSALDDAGIPTRDRVFAQLARVTVAHFACHGVSDLAVPSHSRLLLHDHERDALTVASLASLDLDHARLAYLSACSTALSRNERLRDEAIHVASGFQLAGFSHVIGTQWAINDSIAADIAADFYTHLTGPDATLHFERTAHALHQTIRTRRDQFPRTPSLWAAYLHIGA